MECDPRLPALAATVLQMPSRFRTAEPAVAVARRLGRAPDEYRVTHCRYDLGKLRARNLAERIGSSRRYRPTRIGRIVCETLAECRRSTSVMKLPTERVPHMRRNALSA